MLERASIKDGARSLLFRSSTGYARRFSQEGAGDPLLALHVEDETLSDGHGFPLKLVAPFYRGCSWVKWVTELGMSSDPACLAAPLPVQ